MSRPGGFPAGLIKTTPYGTFMTISIFVMTITAPHVSFAKHGRRILHEIQGLHAGIESTPPSTPAALADVVLVAIDFENVAGIKYRFSDTLWCQVGLALLDIKQLENTALVKAIITHNFVVGSPQYVRNTWNKFLFGRTQTFMPSERQHCIFSCIPPRRNIIIVGHGIGTDLSASQALDIHLAATTIVLDTCNIAMTCLD